ncbi:MAG: nucleotide exchange factor GrpE [Candidatus Izemoplasma sp.]|nr:nucleotide exchange factor GrpE [Candidatus Izemoplasma sp.]
MSKKKKDVLNDKETIKDVDAVKKDVESSDLDEEKTDIETESTEEETLTQEEQLQQEIDELKSEISELQKEVLKQHADVENTKKRLEKQHVTDRKYAAFGIAKALIEPLDNFDMALSHMKDDDKTKSFIQGFKMINKQLHQALESEGVKEIDALGEEFDPKYHQAVMKEPSDDTDSDIVIEVLQKGYMYKDRVIRPAMVKISE